MSKNEMEQVAISVVAEKKNTANMNKAAGKKKKAFIAVATACAAIVLVAMAILTVNTYSPDNPTDVGDVESLIQTTEVYHCEMDSTINNHTLVQNGTVAITEMEQGLLLEVSDFRFIMDKETGQRVDYAKYFRSHNGTLWTHKESTDQSATSFARVCGSTYFAGENHTLFTTQEGIQEYDSFVNRSENGSVVFAQQSENFTTSNNLDEVVEMSEFSKVTLARKGTKHSERDSIEWSEFYRLPPVPVSNTSRVKEPPRRNLATCEGLGCSKGFTMGTPHVCGHKVPFGGSSTVNAPSCVSLGDLEQVIGGDYTDRLIMKVLDITDCCLYGRIDIPNAHGESEHTLKFKIGKGDIKLGGTYDVWPSEGFCPGNACLTRDGTNSTFTGSAWHGTPDLEASAKSGKHTSGDYCKSYQPVQEFFKAFEDWCANGCKVHVFDCSVQDKLSGGLSFSANGRSLSRRRLGAQTVPIFDRYCIATPLGVLLCFGADMTVNVQPPDPMRMFTGTTGRVYASVSVTAYATIFEVAKIGFKLEGRLIDVSVTTTPRLRFEPRLSVCLDAKMEKKPVRLTQKFMVSYIKCSLKCRCWYGCCDIGCRRGGWKTLGKPSSKNYGAKKQKLFEICS